MVDVSPAERVANSDFESADSRLSVLLPGLTSSILIEAVVAAYESTVNSDNGFGATNCHGSLFYQFGTMELRERLSELGWSMDDPHNVARAISPDGSLAIVFARGNSSTGIMGSGPVISEKGRGSRSAFGQMIIPGLEPKLESGNVWYLVGYYDAVEQEIRSELSLPRFIDGSNTIYWLDRIILPTHSLSLDRIRVPLEEPSPVLQVTRKAV